MEQRQQNFIQKGRERRRERGNVCYFWIKKKIKEDHNCFRASLTSGLYPSSRSKLSLTVSANAERNRQRNLQRNLQQSEAPTHQPLQLTGQRVCRVTPSFRPGGGWRVWGGGILHATVNRRGGGGNVSVLATLTVINYSHASTQEPEINTHTHTLRHMKCILAAELSSVCQANFFWRGGGGEGAYLKAPVCEI